MQIDVAAAGLVRLEHNPQQQPGGQFLCSEIRRTGQSFDAVRVKYINLDSVKSDIFTKLESSMTQRWTHIVHKVDTGADGNLMPL